MNYQISAQSVPLSKDRVDRVLFLSIGLNIIVSLLMFYSFKMGQFVLNNATDQTVRIATGLHSTSILDKTENASRAK